MQLTADDVRPVCGICVEQLRLVEAPFNFVLATCSICYGRMTRVHYLRCDVNQAAKAYLSGDNETLFA